MENDVAMMLAAIVGMGLAIEGRDYTDRERAGFRYGLLLILLTGAASAAETIDGFLFYLFMPIGAYKVAQLVTVAALYGWRRLRLG